MKTHLIISCAFIYSAIIFGNDGGLDPSFGSSGLVTTNSEFNISFGTTIQADGKIIAAGEATVAAQIVFALARYNLDGSLDGTFGSGGKVTTPFSGGARINGVTLQPDGKIIAVGEVFPNINTTEIAIARYNKDGSLDGTFGSGGKVQTQFPGSTNSEGRAVAIQADGKIIVAGRVVAGSINHFGVARYNVDGSLDNSFGGNGMVVLPNFPGTASGNGDVANAVAIQADGKIVLVGQVFPSGQHRFGIARVNSDGTLDTTFSGGEVIITFNPSTIIEDAFGVALQPDGKIIAAGLVNVGPDFALARLNMDGTLDASFGVGGKTTTSFTQGEAEANAVSLQSDGKILLAGFTGNPQSGNFDFALARYNTNGIADPSFGSGGTPGTVATPFPPFGTGRAIANAIAIQSNGNIVLAGDSERPVFNFALARYLSQPPLTATTITFPTNGTVITTNSFTISGTAQNPANVTIFANGQIIARGVTSDATNTWSFNLSGLANGTYTLSADAHYKSGNVDIASDPINITINILKSQLVQAIQDKYCK